MTIIRRRRHNQNTYHSNHRTRNSCTTGIYSPTSATIEFSIAPVSFASKMIESSSKGLLAPEVHAHDDDDMSETEACIDRRNRHPIPAVPPSSLPVYMTIHRVRRLVAAAVDEPYSLEQLKDHRVNKEIVRPLVDRLYTPSDISVVYCLLANRVQFLREQSSTVHQTVTIARATLCELAATLILRRLHEEHTSEDGLLLLSHVLVEGFDPFQGAPDSVQLDTAARQWRLQEREGHERKLTALELAIISESKTFISSPACQRVVNAVYEGQVIYTPLSVMDILPDHYRHHPISLYDPRKAPILNHYRLIVPRWRNAVEMCQFLILLGLYVLTMVYRNDEGTELFELMFSIYTAGWVLSELAAIAEHGWEVHSQSLWSFLDLTFIFIYGAYVIARIFDIYAGRFPLGQGLHILCIAAPVLLTRLAFTLLPNNIVFISVRAAMSDFMMLTFLATWCFVGFLLALQWLIDSDDNSNTTIITPRWSTIAKWMLWIWFGLDGTGFDEAGNFHSVFGPALMVAFAFLGNTLFLTLTIAVLTNTFSRIIADATGEVAFRRTVLTFEGVKSDAIFAYPPPTNIIALVVLLPLKLLVSPAVFHTVNVSLVRALNAPALLLISLYERRRSWSGGVLGRRRRGKNPFLNWHFTGFSPYDNVQAVFKTSVPDEMGDAIERLDPLEKAPRTPIEPVAVDADIRFRR
ncbi:hypothetical protein MCOR25_005063 [Pyricularia grisea]|nr:hypothetical protein MCOR25_005063 [Pyricularia grisea]